jgi:predicted PurR-regulated permease PerM
MTADRGSLFDVSWRAIAKVVIAAVLVAVIVGAELAGVMGALLALLIAAIYPTIERIRLRERLSGDIVEIYQRLSA